MQAPCLSTRKSRDVTLGKLEHGNDFISQIQQSSASAGKPRRFRLPDEQGAVQPILEILKLMG
jgi:hypothetical protein